MLFKHKQMSACKIANRVPNDERLWKRYILKCITSRQCFDRLSLVDDILIQAHNYDRLSLFDDILMVGEV